VQSAKCKVQNLKNRGLTLIEILVAMGIATVAGMLLLVIIVNSAGLFQGQSSKVQTGLNVNDALSKIRASAKQASAIANSYTDGQTVYTTGSDQLVLKVASVDGEGNIIENLSDYFVFFKDQSYLRFKVFPDPSSFRKVSNEVLTASLESVVFNYFNLDNPPLEVNPSQASKVRISISLRQRIGTRVEINTATSEANLRND